MTRKNSTDDDKIKPIFCMISLQNSVINAKLTFLLSQWPLVLLVREKKPSKFYTMIEFFSFAKNITNTFALSKNEIQLKKGSEAQQKFFKIGFKQQLLKYFSLNFLYKFSKHCPFTKN